MTVIEYINQSLAALSWPNYQGEAEMYLHKKGDEQKELPAVYAGSGQWHFVHQTDYAGGLLYWRALELENEVVEDYADPEIEVRLRFRVVALVARNWFDPDQKSVAIAAGEQITAALIGPLKIKNGWGGMCDRQRVEYDIRRVIDDEFGGNVKLASDLVGVRAEMMIRFHTYQSCLPLTICTNGANQTTSTGRA